MSFYNESQVLKKKKKLLSEMKIESFELASKTEEELSYHLHRLKKKQPSLIEWFALVQEISFRKLGLKHFDTQLLAGLILEEGKIVEMKTGEGKTLVSTLPVSYNALNQKGVHVVTVNEYLAERDQKWMGKIYQALGLSTGLIKSTSSLEEKKKAYNADITYLTNSELVFDYLRDISSYNFQKIVQRPFNFCLIDEIDSILIDEARTPLILSESLESTMSEKLYLAQQIAKSLENSFHFEVDEKRRDIHLTEIGYETAIRKLGKTSLYDLEDPWILEILNALKANYLFKKNKDYMLQNQKIMIIDEFTGRILEDRRWSMGLHEAVEMKEGLSIGGGTKAKVSITYQNFFPLYPKLAGMTGTALTNAKEFADFYNLEVVSVPTRKPMIRQDFPDLIFQTERAKWVAVLNQSKQCFEKGQPILIGTSTIEKSDLLSDLFNASGIPHKLLNAKPENIQKESEIVAQAGKRYAVTIATNMAGRGTDIILGGNPFFEVKQQVKREIWKWVRQQPRDRKSKLDEIFTKYELALDQLKTHIENLPYSLDECEPEVKDFYNQLYEKAFPIWKEENQLVKELGGLFVLGTERHETRRIDNQLRGRAGRQGDPGSSQFVVCLQDELIQLFGGDSLRRWISFLVEDETVVLDSGFLTSSLENAQKKVENYNYEIRQNIFQYDNIITFQRKQLFQIRFKLLAGNLVGIYEDLLLRSTEKLFDQLEKKTKKHQHAQPKVSKIFQNSARERNFNCGLVQNSGEKFRPEIWITTDFLFAKSNFYQQNFLKNTRIKKVLKIVDARWTDHMDRVDYIRETINWRSYGQQNPLIEYNFQASKSFQLMLEEIRRFLIYSFLTL